MPASERLDLEGAGRDVDPGEAQNPFGLGEGGKVVVAPGLQQGVLGQGARGHHTDHRAGDHGLGAALARLGGVFRLFADRHPKALADEALQIGVRGVDRHAAHRHIGIPVASTARQRDIERLRRRHRVIEEQLVEIAHAVKQEAARIGLLDREILHHHRRGGAGARGPVPDGSFAGRTRAPLFALPGCVGHGHPKPYHGARAANQTRHLAMAAGAGSIVAAVR